MSNRAAPAPGEGSEDHTKNRIIDLNTADEATLAGLPMIGPDKARMLVQHRPYSKWRDVEKIPGLGGGTVDILAMAGVQLGDGGEARLGSTHKLKCLWKWCRLRDSNTRPHHYE